MKKIDYLFEILKKELFIYPIPEQKGRLIKLNMKGKSKFHNSTIPIVFNQQRYTLPRYLRIKDISSIEIIKGRIK